MVIFLFGGYSGGIANYVRNIVKNLDIEYKICCPEYNKNEFKKVFDDKCLIYFDTENKSLITLFKDLYGFKKALNVKDNITIHSHALRFGVIAVIFKIFFLKKIKLIYTDHGSPFKQTTKIIKKIYLFSSEILVNIFAYKIVCIREIEYNYWKKFILFNSKLNYIKTQIEMPKYKSKIKENSITIAMVGKIYSLKNPDLFVEISRLNFNTKRKINFIWVGEGNSEIYKDISSVNNLEFLGQLSFEDMYDLWPTIDILLLTSKVEVLPLIAIEAMNFRSIVIANNYYGVKELIDHEKNGFIFTSSDEAKYYIEKVINQKNVSERVLDFAEKRINNQRKNINYFCNEYIKLYK